MPSLGGGGAYGGDDPTGGSRTTAGRTTDRNRNKNRKSFLDSLREAMFGVPLSAERQRAQAQQSASAIRESARTRDTVPVPDETPPVGDTDAEERRAARLAKKKKDEEAARRRGRSLLTGYTPPNVRQRSLLGGSSTLGVNQSTQLY